MVIAGIPFNATLWFFGNVELVGHLPIYGAMLVLLVYGSEPSLRAGLTETCPWGHGATTRRRVRPAQATETAR